MEKILPPITHDLSPTLLYEIPYLPPSTHNLTFFTRSRSLKDYAFRTMTLLHAVLCVKEMGCQGLKYGK
jgi:hypothetical protein